MTEETRVKLTAQQLRDLRQTFHATRLGHKLLADLFVEIAEKLAKDETDLWDQVYELAGLTDETHIAQIRYITSEVVFTPRKESVV